LPEEAVELGTMSIAPAMVEMEAIPAEGQAVLVSHLIITEMSVGPAGLCQEALRQVGERERAGILVKSPNRVLKVKVVP
jgi:hypothetical protein